MHELAITESLVNTVREYAGESKVIRVRLAIGKLSGVVPGAVGFCFDVCAAGTPLEGARLEVEEVAARVRCRTCDAELVLEDAIPLCTCGSADVDVLSGHELKIKEVEVA
jgi:hydrogenase nickel incorporation protein HypA/HybF